ncbi:MAG: hypothetical protein K0S98_1825 [Propionibacteriaceae bacterium]|jgi:hypothetical protein|nr:hypothetical protein [Propionibacteriaceae bacterium]
MDGQRMDRIARSLARDVSRRRVMKAMAVALGVAATGTLRSATAAPDWCRGLYRCDGVGPLTVICTAQHHRDVVHDRGTTCVLEQEAACNFSSEESCESEV